MAGVCVNVGFYGMWRTLALLGRPPGWLAGSPAAARRAHRAAGHRARRGAATGCHRVIAYSSVENTGLIITGFGVALTGAAVGDRRLIAVGLLAATLQMVAHTAAKSLLFSSSARASRPRRAATTWRCCAAWGAGRRGAARAWPWAR